jgi:hypothetical protein
MVAVNDVVEPIMVRAPADLNVVSHRGEHGRAEEHAHVPAAAALGDPDVHALDGALLGRLNLENQLDAIAGSERCAVDLGGELEHLAAVTARDAVHESERPGHDLPPDFPLSATNPATS